MMIKKRMYIYKLIYVIIVCVMIAKCDQNTYVATIVLELNRYNLIKKLVLSSCTEVTVY